MSAVWPTTWHLLGVGLQNAPSKVATRSKASQFVKNLSILSSSGKSRFHFVSGKSNGPYKCTSDAQFPRRLIGPDGFKKLPIVKSYVVKASFSTGSEKWTFSSAEDANPLSHPRAPASMSLSDVDIREIFGGSLDTQKGNELLQILQDQRISGTLDEEIDASPTDITKGLAWLRITMPVDEDQAIIARLEREEIEDEREAERLRLYKPQQDPSIHGIYGESALQKIREINKQKAAEWEKEKQKRKEERRNRVTASPSKAVVERRAKRAAWVQHYKERAQRKGKLITDMTKFERLGPSTMVAVSVVLLSILVAHFYTPPSENARLFPDLPPAAATVITLIGINALIFFSWKFPPAWKLLNQHFVIVAAYPTGSGIIGSVFSHQHFMHLARNMFVLFFAGTQLHDDIGRGQFLAVYLSCGVLASLGSLGHHVLRNHLHTTSLGASGAICGVFACWAWLHRGETLVLPFAPREVTQWVSFPAILAVLIISDIIYLRRGHLAPFQWAQVDYMAHLTGYAVGIGVGELLRVRRGQSQVKRDKEKEKKARVVGGVE